MLWAVFFWRGCGPRLARVLMTGGAAVFFFVLFPCAAHAAPHHHAAKPETDFDCAVHTAYGEARHTSRAEEAVVINLLVERARLAHLSICKAAHKFFRPRNGSTPDVLAAVRNVLQGDKSLVPEKFRHVTEMRAYRAPKPPAGKFHCVGSVDQKPGNGLHGNIFYEPVVR